MAAFAPSALRPWALVAALALGALLSLWAATAPAAEAHVRPTAQRRVAVPAPLGGAPHARPAPFARPPLAPHALRAAAGEESPARASAGSMAGAGLVGVAAAAVGALIGQAVGQKASAGGAPAGLSRRGFGAWAGAAVLVPLVAGQAQAELLPDDNDPELVARAKANRKQKLAAEKQLERDTDPAAALRTTDPQLAAVQNVVISLSVVGRKLAEGTIDRSTVSAAAAIKTVELKATVAELSGDAQAKALGDKALGELKGLISAIQSGALPTARPAYVSTVAALKAWCGAAGVADRVVGL